jgi:hypothetical protein
MNLVVLKPLGGIATREGKVTKALRNMFATATVWLLGMFLLGPTSAIAEEDMNMALRAYDLANPTDRRTAEIVFANVQSGIWWANSVLLYKKQQPLFCPPDNVAPLPGPLVIEMVRQQVNKYPTFGEMPYGLAIVMTIQANYPCKD